ncbi:MAG: glycosyltransferase family 4 protein [Candidatus Omnitrophica bacterium]|nr:glycosyltransferase family 4 protein [Candidatus Omnitrophota bacterium]
MNILVIPDKSYPLHHALLEHIFYRILPERGHKITWLLPSSKVNTFNESKQWGSTDVILNPFINSNERILQVKYFLYTKFRSMWQIIRIARERNIDIIFVRNDLTAALIASIAARRLGIRFVYYLGFPIQEAILEGARRGLHRSRILGPLYVSYALPLRNWLTKRADFVFTMSTFWQKKIIKKLSLSSDKVGVLPFGFDTSVNTHTIDRNIIRNKFNINENSVILYMGTIIPLRNVTILIDILERVIAIRQDVRLIILVGKGNNHLIDSFKKKFEERNLHHYVIFVPTVPHSEVPLYIRAADVGLSPVEKIPVYEVSSPAKFIEMLGMGLPVVASDIPEQKNILEQTRAGLTVPFEPTAFANAILHILEHPAEAQQMGQEGRKYVEQERGFETLASHVESILKRILTD